MKRKLIGKSVVISICAALCGNVAWANAPQVVTVQGIQFNNPQENYEANNPELLQPGKNLQVQGDINIVAKLGTATFQGQEVHLNNINLTLGIGADKGTTNTIFINNGSDNDSSSLVTTKNINLINGEISLAADNVQTGDVNIGGDFSRFLVSGQGNNVTLGNVTIQGAPNQPIGEFYINRFNNQRAGNITTGAITLNGTNSGTPISLKGNEINVQGDIKVLNTTSYIKNPKIYSKTVNLDAVAKMNIKGQVQITDKQWVNLNLSKAPLNLPGTITIDKEGEFTVNNFDNDYRNKVYEGQALSFNNKITNNGKLSTESQTLKIQELDNGTDGIANLTTVNQPEKYKYNGYQVSSSDDEFLISIDKLRNAGEFTTNYPSVFFNSERVFVNELEGCKEGELSLTYFNKDNMVLTVNKASNTSYFVFNHVDTRDENNTNKIIFHQPSKDTNHIFFPDVIYSDNNFWVKPYEDLLLAKDNPEEAAKQGINPVLPLVDVQNPGKTDSTIGKRVVYMEEAGDNALKIKSAKFSSKKYGEIFKKYFPQAGAKDIIYYLGFGEEDLEPNILPIGLINGSLGAGSLMYDLITEPSEINRGYGNYSPKETPGAGLWAKVSYGRNKDDYYKGHLENIAVGINKIKESRNYGLAYSYKKLKGDLNKQNGDVKGHSYVFEGYHQTNFPKDKYITMKLGVGHANTSFKTVAEDELYKGGYGKNFMRASLELGRRINYDKGHYLAPQVEFSYASLGSGEYVVGDNVKVLADGIKSNKLRLGVTYGYKKVKDNKENNFYVAGNYFHEFAGKSDLTFIDGDGTVTKGKLNRHGSWGNLGLGYSLKHHNKNSMYMSYAHTLGSKVKQGTLNVGIKWLF